jgi:hypothetical protein
MTRRFNTKHPQRGKSNYPKRLAARRAKGFSGNPAMLDLPALRKKQGADDDNPAIWIYHSRSGIKDRIEAPAIE